MAKLSRKKIFYVYALLDPRKPGYFRYGRWVFHFEPFYIGKGSGNRLHVHDENCKNNSKKATRIRVIKRAKLEPVRVIKKQGLTEKQALWIEKQLVSRIGRHLLKEGPLLNIAKGGQAGHGWLSLSAEEKLNKTNKAAQTRKNKPEALKKITAAKSRKTLAEASQKEKQRRHSERMTTIVARGTKQDLYRKVSESNKLNWQNRSKQEKCRHALVISICKNQMTKVQIASAHKKRMTTLSAKSEAEKEATRKLRSENTKRYFANLTNEQRMERSSIASRGQQKRHSMI